MIFSSELFKSNGTYFICLGSSCNITVTGQNWLVWTLMAMKRRWHSSTMNILFRSQESIILVTSVSLCLSLTRGALLKWGSLTEFHSTSTQPTMEVNYVSSAVVRMDLPSPPLGLIGLSTTIPLHKVRNISQAAHYVCMWGKR